MLNLALTAVEQRALINSILISIGVSFFSVAISIFISWSLNFFKLPGRRIFYFLFLIPLLIPPYLHAFSAMHFAIFLTNSKILGSLTCCVVEMLNSRAGVTMLLTISYFPIAFFIINQTLRNIPQEIFDSAIQIARPIKVIKRIILPYLYPSIVTASLLIFVITFITFDVPAFFGKNVFVTQIFKSFTLSNDVTRAFYLSSIPVIILGIIWSILLIRGGYDKPFFSLNQTKSPNFKLKNLSNSLTFLILAIFVSIVIITVVLPMSLLLIKSFSYNEAPFYTVSAKSVIINSIGISLVSSLAIVIFAFFVLFTIYKKIFGRIIFLSLLIVPPITFGILFIYIFNHPLLNIIYSTPVILIIAYCLRFAPMISEFLYIHKLQINPQYFESARLVSASDWSKLLLIFLPLFKPAIFSAWMFSFWLVATEIPITLLIQPPGFQTIITRLFIVLHYGAEEMMSLLTLILLSVSFFPILAVYLYLKIDNRQRKNYE